MDAFLLTGLDPLNVRSYGVGANYVVTNETPAVPAPVVLSAPVLAGLPQVGEDMQIVTAATFSGDGLSQPVTVWEHSTDGGTTWTPHPSASGLLYTAQQSDLTHRVRVYQTITNAGGTSPRAISNELGPIAPVPVVYPRAETATTTRLLFDGHSGVQTGNGASLPDTPGGHGGILSTAWPGGTITDYYPFGTLKQIWEQDGPLRNGDYGAVLASEATTDLVNGYPALGAAAESMQYLLWHGETAHARGASFDLMAMWAPGENPGLFANTIPFFEGLRQWYQAETGRPIWIVPAAHLIRDLLADGAVVNQVYADVIHLTPRYARAISYLEYGFFTHQRCPFVQAGDEDLDEAAWQTLLTYECAGMGGPVTTTVPPYTNPLPDPLPLPGGSAFTETTAWDDGSAWNDTATWS